MHVSAEEELDQCARETRIIEDTYHICNIIRSIHHELLKVPLHVANGSRVRLSDIMQCLSMLAYVGSISMFTPVQPKSLYMA